MKIIGKKTIGPAIDSAAKELLRLERLLTTPSAVYTPRFSNGLTVVDDGNLVRKIALDTLIVFVNRDNCVEYSREGVYLLSGLPKDKTFTLVSVNEHLWRDSLGLFVARSITNANWLNRKDQFKLP